MVGSIGALALAACFLIASHLGLSSTPLRAMLVARLGERGFTPLYSALALVGLVWLVAAYRAAPYVPLWGPAAWQWLVPLLAMPVALVLLVGGLSLPNPTALGQDRHMAAEEPGLGALRITRHPVMWAIALWGLAHLVPNGDLASLVFFGSLAALALLGTRLIDAKQARRQGLLWAHFAGATSNLPFAAIAGGRQSLGLAVREIGWLRLAAAVALYGALLHGHRWLFGVSPLPPV